MKDFNFFSIKALLKDLKSFHEEKAIDVIFITGDLIDQGGDSFSRIDIAFQEFEKNVINKIINKLSLSKDKFIFVPGNHDIDRKADKEMHQNGLTSTLKTTEKVNEFIDSEDMDGIRRILPYKKFEKKFHENFTGEKVITNFQSSYIVNVDGVKIGINAFNTAWRCYDSKTDKEKILLGERQLFNGLEYIDDCDIKIALMHHNVDWLAEFDRNSIFNFMNQHYDMLFCGHVHYGTTWSYKNSFGNIFVSVASLNKSKNTRNYNVHACQDTFFKFLSYELLS
jgi:UDP-2,3-diacylglucosamine pyrophosphatase LpxH